VAHHLPVGRRVVRSFPFFVGTHVTLLEDSIGPVLTARDAFGAAVESSLVVSHGDQKVAHNPPLHYRGTHRIHTRLRHGVDGGGGGGGRLLAPHPMELHLPPVPSNNIRQRNTEEPTISHDVCQPPRSVPASRCRPLPQLPER
jgi:hypothetical protein